ncbi:site-specific integrase [Rhodococcus sp. (in: high G+C Gram-positive bacteria)]|uniref:tyrosine-type recombinase/integrase n=1 Tax=Rhodococcus sp. TaxID=1831 RepID=UPI00257F1E12|nr:site-specific integrase [Rhodococcus sp. (in: high G+C Gram-positive bacteria)]
MDGKTRSIQRDTPAGQRDTHGKLAEDALIDAIADALNAGVADVGTITSATEVSVLAAMYRDSLLASDRAIRTKDTYARIVDLMLPRIESLRIREATPQRLGRILDDLGAAHGATTAKQAKTVMTAMFAVAVREGAAPRNPVRDVETIRVSSTSKETTRGLTAAELLQLLDGLQSSAESLPVQGNAKKEKTTRTVSQWAKDVDLVDPVVMLAGTGLRRSELLALRWDDYDAAAGTVTVAGHVVRAKGGGLVREDETKTATSARTIPLPDYVVEMLDRRKGEPHPVNSGLANVVFPSSAGTYRDPDNFAGQWRRVRGALGFDWVATHTFRRTVGTMLDEAGLSARIGADHLGHAKVSMTQDHYQVRNRVHQAAAKALSLSALRINVE